MEIIYSTKPLPIPSTPGRRRDAGHDQPHSQNFNLEKWRTRTESRSLQSCQNVAPHAVDRRVRHIAPRQSTFLPLEPDHERQISGLTSHWPKLTNTPFNPSGISRHPIAAREPKVADEISSAQASAWRRPSAKLNRYGSPYSDSLRTGRSEERVSLAARFQNPSRWSLWPTQPPVQGVPVLSREQSSRLVALTTHPDLEPRL